MRKDDAINAVRQTCKRLLRPVMLCSLQRSTLPTTLFHSWLILPELLGCRAEIAEMVDGCPGYLKGERVEWFGFHSLDKIFVGNSQRDVGNIFRATGFGDEMLDPADGIGIGVIAHKSRCGATAH